MFTLMIHLVFFLQVVNSNPDAKRLYDDLLTNYNRLIRPVGNSSDRLTVEMGLKLSQIIGIDMKRQIMITNVWVEQEWLDYKLKWNPNDYGGVRYLHVPSQHIWLPDIVLYNNADGNYEVTIMTKAELHYTGKVTWNPPAIYKSSCEIDVEFFPFDEQKCSMKFGSWTYDGYMVDLRHINQRGSNNQIEMGMDLQEYYISTEWDIMSAAAIRNEKYYPCCEEPFPDIIFYLTLRRKSLFYTVNVIIPCVGISFLSLLVFYLPSQSGEKVSLSISILLSLTVFFLLLAEIIPSTSMAVPLLGKYLLFTMILVTFSVVVTIGVLNVNFRTPATHKMAPWVRKTFVQFLPKYLMMKRPEPEPNPETDVLESSLVSDLNNDDDRTGNRTSCSKNECYIIPYAKQISDGDFRSEHSDEATCEFINSRNRLFDDTDVDPSKSTYSGSSTNKLFVPQPIWSEMSSIRMSTPAMNKQIVDQMQNGRGFRSKVMSSNSHHRRSIGPICLSRETTVFKDGPDCVASKTVSTTTSQSNIREPSSSENRSKQPLDYALSALRFIAMHVKNTEKYGEHVDDWKYVAMVLDRILLWIFTIACVTGTASIIMAAPSHYDSRQPIDVKYSKVVDKQNMVMMQFGGSTTA